MIRKGMWPLQLHLGGEDQFFELLAVEEGEKAGKLHVLQAEAGKGEGHLPDIQGNEEMRLEQPW